MKLRNALLVQLRAEIDENIAATDQVEPRKWRIRRDVLPGEGAEFADGVLDLIHAVALEKKAPQARS